MTELWTPKSFEHKNLQKDLLQHFKIDSGNYGARACIVHIVTL